MDWEEYKNKNACARVHNILERMFPGSMMLQLREENENYQSGPNSNYRKRLY